MSEIPQWEIKETLRLHEDSLFSLTQLRRRWHIDRNRTRAVNFHIRLRLQNRLGGRQVSWTQVSRMNSLTEIKQSNFHNRRNYTVTAIIEYTAHCWAFSPHPAILVGRTMELSPKCLASGSVRRWVTSPLVSQEDCKKSSLNG